MSRSDPRIEVPGPWWRARLHSPSVGVTPDGSDVLSLLARLVAYGAAETKPELMTATGLARSTVTAHVETLMRRGVLAYRGSKLQPGRGRPAERLVVAPEAGVIAAIDIGARHTRLGISRLDGAQAIQHVEDLDVRDGPDVVLERVARLVASLIARIEGPRTLRCSVVGVPSRVDGTAGVPVRPNLMPGWDGFPVAQALQGHLGGGAILENDVNLRALGEASILPREDLPLVAIKVATGVGAGIVGSDGRLFRGFDGAAGDIGHIPVRRAPAIRCVCGTIGCVEAMASIPALVAVLKSAVPARIQEAAAGREELFDLLRRGDVPALAAVRNGAEALGEAVAGLCNTLNPRRIVISGEITEATDEVLAGVRAVAYQTARPQATRNLIISHSALGEQAGITGAFVLGVETAFSTESLGRWRATRTAIGSEAK